MWIKLPVLWINFYENENSISPEATFYFQNKLKKNEIQDTARLKFQGKWKTK